MRSFVLCMLCLPIVCHRQDKERQDLPRDTRDAHKSLFPWEPSTNEHAQQRPQFKETERVVSVSPGDTAVLRCQVQNLGSKTVTWRRYGSIHPLTIGSITFVSNSRVHAERKRLLLTTTTISTTRATKLHVKTTTTATSATTTSQTSSVPPRRMHQPTPRFRWSAKLDTSTTPVYRPFQPVLIPARGHGDDYDDDYDDDYANFAYLIHSRGVRGVNLDGSMSEETSVLGIERRATGRQRRRRMDGANESSVSVDEWNLFITDVRPSDQDIYQCQVNSKDDQYNFYDIFLKVKNIRVYGSQKVEQGSEIQLTCNVTSAFQDQPPLQQQQQNHHQPQLVQSSFPVQQKNFTSPLPNFLAWFKDGQLVMSDPRKGISVSREISEKSSASVLTVKKAQLTDGGIYVCREGTDWKSRWDNFKKADNLVADETHQHSSVLDSSEEFRQHQDSLMSRAFQPDSASIYVHVISSASLEKRGTLAEKVTSDSIVNTLSVTDVSTTFVVYIYIMKLS